MPNLWKTYQNGDYTIHIHAGNGTKLRVSHAEHPKASFAESIDVTITTRCQQACPYCYLGCQTDGVHADLTRYPFLQQLPPYTELAINGNDLDHPELLSFLQKLQKQQVFANLTVQQEPFLAHTAMLQELTQKGLVHGIGVSFRTPCDALFSALAKFPNAVLHVIAGILSSADFHALAGRNLKLLILGYKTCGRGETYAKMHQAELQANLLWLKGKFSALSHAFAAAGFDTLALTQLDVQSLVPPDTWNHLYAGEEGSHTFYLDLVHGTYALSSMSRETYPIGTKTTQEMFQHLLTLRNS